ncbi:MAG: hypothetical protein ACYDHX_16255 [Methanothrix sp.]
MLAGSFGGQGCSFGDVDGWQESGRAGWPGRPRAREAGGPLGRHRCGLAVLKVDC